MAYSSFFAVLFLGLIFNYGCVSKDDSMKEETVNESVVVDEVPVSTPPVITPPPVVTTPPPVITPPPVVTPSANPQAGKVSLWKRSTSYDCAVFLPADYGSNPNKQYPLILSMHGLNGSVLNTAHTDVGGSKTGFIKQVWGTTLASKYPAIVIAPNWSPVGSSASGLWNHSQLRQLILEALKKYQVDPLRVVVTGLSAGSIATQELIKYSKDLLAGAMPGAYNSTLMTSNPCQMADLPVWVFGNSSDSYFQASGWTGIEPKVQACSNYTHEFTLNVYQSSCGHGCWDTHWAKPEVQQWLINQTR
ncbi:MAG: hypothetical protein H0V66_14645 [Bdellovibrionales bacterium]|nr:hypothetical protein [Bdellovibrionales bacterium]